MECAFGHVSPSPRLPQRGLHRSPPPPLQVLQPQRFSDGIWRLVSALERQLGCLVGCNAYITPPNTQGLAPHHDDIELWICQTQGEGGLAERPKCDRQSSNIFLPEGWLVGRIRSFSEQVFVRTLSTHADPPQAPSGGGFTARWLGSSCRTSPAPTCRRSSSESPSWTSRFT